MLLNFVDCNQHCLVIRYFKVQLNLFVHPVQEDSRAYDLTFAASYCCSCSRTLNNTKVLHENKCFDDTKQLKHSDTKILSVRHCFEGSNCKEFSKVALQLVFFSVAAATILLFSFSASVVLSEMHFKLMHQLRNKFKMSDFSKKGVFIKRSWFQNIQNYFVKNLLVFLSKTETERSERFDSIQFFF